MNERWDNLISGFFKLGIYLLIALFFFFISFVVMNYFVMPAYVGLGEETVVPDFTNMAMEEAQIQAEHAHLSVKVTRYDYNLTVQQNKIMSQSVQAGMKVKFGKEISLTVSKGAERILVPDLAGLNIEQGKINLQAMELVLGDITWVYDDRYEKDVIVSNMPTPNTPVLRRSPVNLVVSKGQIPQYVTVPNLAGKSLDEAQMVLMECGLVLGKVSEEENNDLLPGSVINQSIAPGRETIWGDTVHIILCR